jgi:hypothetical protein
MRPTTIHSKARTACAILLAIACAGGAVLLCVGCGKAKSNAPSAAELKAFDKATAEVKDTWEAAQAADHTNDYARGMVLYYSLLREDLTPEQQAVVAKASTALKQRLDDAAQKGDPAAQAALQELRAHAPGRPR